jgi:CO/xanthine dehydrogenase Mo-binding subunit
MNILLKPRAIGTSPGRLDGFAKLTGTAPYAYEHPLADPLYLYPLQSAIARGRITTVDAAAARALEGVVAVITHENAPRLATDADKELWVAAVRRDPLPWPVRSCGGGRDRRDRPACRRSGADRLCSAAA